MRLTLAALAFIALGAMVAFLSGTSRPGRVPATDVIVAAPSRADCSLPASDTAFLACAARECQGAVRTVLGNDTHAVLGVATRVVPADLRYVRLVGTIDDRAAGDPARGYECEMSGLDVARARVIR